MTANDVTPLPLKGYLPLREDTLRVTICHRTDEGWMFSEFPDTLEGGPREWPRLTEVYTYEVPRTQMREDSPHDGCFRMNNAVDGSEINVTHQVRSLSVGDVVKVADLTAAKTGGKAYRCWAVNNFGWKTIEHRDVLKAQQAERLLTRQGTVR